MIANEGHDNWITVTILLAKHAGYIVTERAGISLSQYRLLLRLLAANNANGQTAKALSEELGLSPSSVTSALNDLESLGAAQRREDGRDRRVVRVSITDSGADLIAKVDPALCQLAHEFWSVYDDNELAMTKRDSASTVLERRLGYMKIDGISVENAYIDSSLVTLASLNAHMRRANISLNEYRVLHLLSRYEQGLRVKDLSRRLLLRSNEVCVAASKLEEHGRLERVKLPSDRRATCFTITERGTEKLGKMTPAIIDSLQNDITELSENAFDLYDSIANKILAQYRQSHLLE
ncbi:MAG: MarR family transcriptional regulator [Coriobacteriales bacterium]|nr:MarR family transcriptional regulator [Coriobacteriales bacterium]